MIHLDTQIVTWLYLRKIRNLGDAAQRLLRRTSAPMISPFVIVELEILTELGRISPPSVPQMIATLEDQIGLVQSEASMSAVSEAACRFAWTRDPFDRLIVANAMADGAKLITADQMILRHFDQAVW
ncbi:type II toxin-antitoxin system VapC family toxin [Brevundimonas sp. SORGH_AS_0993]|uniref:type II toxin-antitoxin system VapC family toxin n=1 Tax=Brevundimonas sp. SORGH_AS_0993 TaxID=3041794 RepID=UPI00278923C8|nr:PIN domain-containing protein [Brevundimonas sp. SORGH_AS_0993]MDQ1154000.1 PIN domain nuclease of toxin-antitoxin system [Brevundimonas sp. SORGH_AS_0993]